jgi:hypothetical protein
MSAQPWREPVASPTFRDLWPLWLVAPMVVLVFASLVPYAYPVNDDWHFAAVGRDSGIWHSVSVYWRHGGGRVLAAALTSACGLLGELPLIYPRLIAAVLSLILLGGLPLVALLRPATRGQAALAAVALAATQFAAMPVLRGIGNLGPYVATPETLYWLGGSFSYSLAYPVLALGLWALVRVRGWVGWVTPGLAGLAAAGLSETAAILAGAVGAAAVLAGCRRGWVLLGAGLMGLLVCAAAPGNLARLAVLRQQIDPQAGLARLPIAAATATVWLVGRLGEWLLDPSVVAAALLAAWHGAGLVDPFLARRLTRAAVVVVGGVWAAAIPSFALIGFLEARQEGLFSLVAVPALIGLAAAIGAIWTGCRHSVRALVLATGWTAAAMLRQALAARDVCDPGSWTAVVGLVLALVGLIGLLAHWRGSLAGLMALGLLWHQGVWQAVGDRQAKAPAVHACQLARDAEVRRLVEAGHTSIAVPWLGEASRQPRTIRLYEVQTPGGVAAYREYFGLTALHLFNGIDKPVPYQPPPK